MTAREMLTEQTLLATWTILIRGLHKLKLQMSLATLKCGIQYYTATTGTMELPNRF